MSGEEANAEIVWILTKPSAGMLIQPKITHYSEIILSHPGDADVTFISDLRANFQAPVSHVLLESFSLWPEDLYPLCMENSRNSEHIRMPKSQLPRQPGELPQGQRQNRLLKEVKYKPARNIS